MVIERGDTSYGAYAPDLSGCLAAAEAREEVVKLIHEAIEQHRVFGFASHHLNRPTSVHQ